MCPGSPRLFICPNRLYPTVNESLNEGHGWSQWETYWIRWQHVITIKRKGYWLIIVSSQRGFSLHWSACAICRHYGIVELHLNEKLVLVFRYFTKCHARLTRMLCTCLELKSSSLGSFIQKKRTINDPCIEYVTIVQAVSLICFIFR